MQQNPHPDLEINENDLRMVRSEIEILDQVLEKAKTPETLKVYRYVETFETSLKINDIYEGQNVNQKTFEKIQRDFLNQELPQYGFMSTTLTNNPKVFFTHQERVVEMVITLPKNSPAAYLGQVSTITDEYEMLINRGQTIKYDRFSIVNGITAKMLKVEASIVI